MFIIYSTPTCRYCDLAKDLLKKKDLEYEERPHTHPEFPEGKRTVPQIFYRTGDNQVNYIGGYDELRKMSIVS